MLLLDILTYESPFINQELSKSYKLLILDLHSNEINNMKLKKFYTIVKLTRYTESELSNKEIYDIERLSKPINQQEKAKLDTSPIAGIDTFTFRFDSQQDAEDGLDVLAPDDHNKQYYGILIEYLPENLSDYLRTITVRPS